MIQWYPGHMAKAKRLIAERLKLVDIVFELLDARVPLSSRNPDITNVLGNKPRLLLMTKSSMADPILNKSFVEYFEAAGEDILLIDALHNFNRNTIINKASAVLSDKIARDLARGLKKRPIRAMIVGVPNVGKSTMINSLVGRRVTNVGDRPGITKAQQWIRVNPQLELLDTPGVLWPKFADQITGFNLAVSGAIKDDIIHLDDLTLYFLDFLKEHYPNNLTARYNVDLADSNIAILEKIGRIRGIMSGGEVDYERVYPVILNDYRNLHLGRITLDRLPEDV